MLNEFGEADKASFHSEIKKKDSDSFNFGAQGTETNTQSRNSKLCSPLPSNKLAFTNSEYSNNTNLAEKILG